MKKQISAEWQEELEKYLPHGSGVDYDYEIEAKLDWETTLYIHNSWHYMNEYGFYDGVLPFTVVAKNDNVAVHFHVNNAGRYRVNKQGLKNYLEDVFTECLRNYRNVQRKKAGA